MLRRITRWLDLTIFAGCLLYVMATGSHALSWWVGLAVAVALLPFWVWSRIVLGASFTVRPEARRLVTSGPYARLRHPVYVFGTPAVLGLLVAYLGFGGIVLAFIIIPVEILRVRREEAALEAAFGEEYRAYKERTWF